MNIKDLHTEHKAVSAKLIFKGEEGSCRALRLLAGAELAKHQTKSEAMLICMEGEVVFQNDNGVQETLKKGDYINIEPLVDHWINSSEDSFLLLMK